MDRRALGGAALVVAGGFLGRETLVWAFGKVLDLASAGVRNGISFASFSWLNASSLLLIAVGLTLALWPKQKSLPAKPNNSLAPLRSSAIGIVRRVRAHRSAKWFHRDRLEPVADIARSGLALLLTFEKAGFHVPEFDNEYAEQVAAGLESYFASLTPLLGQGHDLEALAMSKSASEGAVATANQLQLQHWFYHSY